jgi:hypothetical protein
VLSGGGPVPGLSAAEQYYRCGSSTWLLCSARQTARLCCVAMAAAGVIAATCSLLLMEEP